MQVIVQNLATEYRDEGVGSVLFFLHGWQDDLHTLDALVPELITSNRVIRLDLPGFGQSETPKSAWGLDDYVLFVRDFIQKLDVSVDTVVGHSFGGRIAIKGVASKNLRVNRIVLIASAGITKKRPMRKVIIGVVAKIVGVIFYIPPLIFWREKLRKKIYSIIGSDYANAGTMKETFLKIVSEDLSESAKAVNTPTLLIWGADDTETPLTDGKRLSQLIYGSELRVIDGAGHFVHREKPEEVAKLIGEFV